MGFRAEEKVDRPPQNKRPPGTFVAGRPFVAFPSHDCSCLKRKRCYALLIKRCSERNPNTIAPIAATFVILAPMVAPGPMAALKPPVIVEAYMQARRIMIAVVRVPALAPAIANLIRRRGARAGD